MQLPSPSPFLAVGRETKHLCQALAGGLKTYKSDEQALSAPVEAVYERSPNFFQAA